MPSRIEDDRRGIHAPFYEPEPSTDHCRRRARPKIPRALAGLLISAFRFSRAAGNATCAGPKKAAPHERRRGRREEDERLESSWPREEATISPKKGRRPRFPHALGGGKAFFAGRRHGDPEGLGPRQSGFSESERRMFRDGDADRDPRRPRFVIRRHRIENLRDRRPFARNRPQGVRQLGQRRVVVAFPSASHDPGPCNSFTDLTHAAKRRITDRIMKLR